MFVLFCCLLCHTVSFTHYSLDAWWSSLSEKTQLFAAQSYQILWNKNPCQCLCRCWPYGTYWHTHTFANTAAISVSMSLTMKSCQCLKLHNVSLGCCRNMLSEQNSEPKLIVYYCLFLICCMSAGYTHTAKHLWPCNVSCIHKNQMLLCTSYHTTLAHNWNNHVKSILFICHLA